jgi:hypothetical protein
VRRGVGGGLVEHGDVQLPAHAPVDLVHAVAKRVGAGQKAQRFIVDLLAFGSERKPGAATPAQREAEPRFQILHMAAHGGGADVQLELGRGHAAAIDHRLEDAQQAQVHVGQLAQHGAALGGGLRVYLHKSSTEH